MGDHHHEHRDRRPAGDRSEGAMSRHRNQRIRQASRYYRYLMALECSEDLLVPWSVIAYLKPMSSHRSARKRKCWSRKALEES